MYIANPTTEVNNFVFIHRYLLCFLQFFPPQFAVFIEITQGNLRLQSREELRMREAHELKYEYM